MAGPGLRNSDPLEFSERGHVYTPSSLTSPPLHVPPYHLRGYVLRCVGGIVHPTAIPDPRGKFRRRVE